MAECIHFPDDPNAICTLCKPKPKRDPWAFDGEVASISSGGGFEAKYAGTCVDCGGSIYEGDLIRSGGGGYRHVDCRG